MSKWILKPFVNVILSDFCKLSLCLRVKTFANIAESKTTNSPIDIENVIKQLLHASVMRMLGYKALGSLERAQEARVALGCASNNSYASFMLSKLPKCFMIISRHTHADS